MTKKNHPKEGSDNISNAVRSMLETAQSLPERALRLESSLFKRHFKEFEIPFVSIKAILQIADGISDNLKKIKQTLNIDHIDDDNHWNNISTSLTMLLKGANTVASLFIKRSVSTIYDHIKEKFDQEDFINNIQLGAGAGWSVLIELHQLVEFKNGWENFSLTVIDSSPVALATTQLLLKEYYGEELLIRILNSKSENFVENINTQFTGVTLVYGDFSILNDTQAFSEESVHSVYSSHGTAYLEMNKHLSLINSIKTLLKSDGIYLTESLNPEIKLRPNKIKFLLLGIVGNILSGSRINKPKASTIKEIGEEKVIINPTEIEFLAFRRFFAATFRNLKLGMLYKKTIGIATDSANTLGRKVQSSSSQVKSRIPAGLTSIRVDSGKEFTEVVWLKKTS